MTKEERVSLLIEKELEANSYKDYFEILNNRIEENRKLIKNLFFILVIIVLAFPLIIQSKIDDISIGPFNLNDSKVAIGLLPSLFAYTHYKYLSVWFDLVNQKFTYKVLTSKFFSIKVDSTLNKTLIHYSFLDSISANHNTENIGRNFLGCFNFLFWLPVGLAVIFFPFVFECYTIKILYNELGFNTFFNSLLIITPGLIGLFTVQMFIQVYIRETKKEK